MKKNSLIWIAVLIILLSFGASTAISMTSLSRVVKDNEERRARILAANIYDKINMELYEPVTVSLTMANDVFLKDIIMSADSYSDDKLEKELLRYLTSTASHNNYGAAFVVLDSSRRYYTLAGLTKVLDWDNDSHDIWYKMFMDKKVKYELNTDTNEASSNMWTVFVNARITDENGQFLGACGVGVGMTELQKVLVETHNNYGVDINLVNHEGVVQVDVDDINIDTAVLDTLKLDPLDGEYEYKQNKDGYVITKYMENLDYFLVIRKETKDARNTYVTLILMNSITMIVISLLVVVAVILVMNKGTKVAGLLAKRNSLYGLADIYVSMHHINLKSNTITEIKSNDIINSMADKKASASVQLTDAMRGMSKEEFVEGSVEFVNLDTLVERLAGGRTITYEFIGKHSGWCRARFIVEDASLDKVENVIYAVEVINDVKNREEELIKESTVDELTQCLNRRAYEDDIRTYGGVPKEPNFVYVSIDVNGLKNVNDSLGHAAGDELIVGAATCLKQCLGSYGRVYRTGGDEFIAIIFADAQRLEQIKLDLDHTVLNWRGQIVSELSMSCGYVSKQECPESTVDELAKIADQRMYNAKANHYKSKGIDRRGQQEAFNALCTSYTKILQANLTADSFRAIQLDFGEQREDMGYNEKLSLWLRDFAESGQVHPDDLENYLNMTSTEYLKKYFAEGNTAFVIHYRRKVGSEFHKVMMQMVPTRDYSDDNQTIFLYVKVID